MRSGYECGISENIRNIVTLKYDFIITLEHYCTNASTQYLAYMYAGLTKGANHTPGKAKAFVATCMHGKISQLSLRIIRLNCHSAAFF
jgi:hypothetical protein